VKFRLLAVGTRMPSWVDTGVLEYTRRLPADFALQIHQVPLARRGKSIGVAQALDREAAAIEARLEPGDYLVALDVEGRKFDTRGLADRLDRLRSAGSSVALLVGGPDGLSPALMDRAAERWSLSDLTLPHPLVRIVLAEQFYRAWTLLNNHPYHRE